MSPNEQWQEEVYNGLRLCLNLSFPKLCECCGKGYSSLEDFIAKTDAVAGSHGLQEYPDEAGDPVVGLFRNCECGSTLVALCENRRDNTPQGDARRRMFDVILDGFVERGMEREAVRVELRRLLRGQSSELMSRKYGITPQVIQNWFNF